MLNIIFLDKKFQYTKYYYKNMDFFKCAYESDLSSGYKPPARTTKTLKH